MRAAMIHHADLALRIAEGDQPFAQQDKPHRAAIGFQFVGFCRRNPVLAHEIAHHRAGSDTGQVFAVFCCRHRNSPATP